MRRIVDSLKKKTRLAVGLMSGTSTDGVDAALVRIGQRTDAQDRPRLRVRVLAFRSDAYNARMRARLIDAAENPLDAADACTLDRSLGETFARSVARLLDDANVRPERVDVIGSHGHTVRHQPPVGRRPGFSLQLGSGDLIAERTGIPTVTEFRGRDMAVGGQGAPLVPFVDAALFGGTRRRRALQNIGGIANLTVVGESMDDVIAFDTGPGNAMIDHAAWLATGGRQRYDRGGRIAARGTVNKSMLRRLLEHAYFTLPVPKSTGREAFGRAAVEKLARGRTRPGDLVATLTRFTAESIALGYRRHVLGDAPLHEVLLSGGGAHNLTLRAHLEDLLHPIPVRPLERFGLTPDNKEAAAFAVLAHETLAGRPSNLPAATGATWPVILGKVSL